MDELLTLQNKTKNPNQINPLSWQKNKTLWHLNLIKSLDPVANLQKVQKTENYYSRDMISAFQTGKLYRSNDSFLLENLEGKIIWDIWDN